MQFCFELVCDMDTPLRKIYLKFPMFNANFTYYSVNLTFETVISHVNRNFPYEMHFNM